jgi:DNA-binding NarL/FixJ family response regulator
VQTFPANPLIANGGRPKKPANPRRRAKVLTLLATGRSYRLIGRELGLSKNTISAIIKRSRSLISNTP